MGYPWGFCYHFFFIIFKLNSICLQISWQDKHNIDVLMVNIEFMWLGMKRVERLAKARLFYVSKPRRINSMIYTVKPVY